MSVAIITIFLITLLVFIIPIVIDFLALRKTASLHDNLIYTLIKTALYIAYPFFIVYFIDYIKIPDPNAEWGGFINSPYAINQGLVDYVTLFLSIGGISSLFFAKYKVLRFFEVKHVVLLCFVEFFYIPFLLVALLLALW